MPRLVLTLAATAVLCVALAACSAMPGTAAGPTGSVEASLQPSAPPSAESSPTIQPTEPSDPPVDSVPVPPNAYTRVVTDDLRVRSRPGVAEDSKKLEPLLQRGVLLVVLDGPVQASGYDWYQVQPTISLEDAIAYPAGWVAAASRDGEVWIEPDHIECPPPPSDVEGLSELLGNDEMYWEITCFSGLEMTFTARLGAYELTCSDIESAWTWEPGWFGACSSQPLYLEPPDSLPDEYMYWPAWPPGTNAGIAVEPNTPVDDRPVVEVTGMFDHPLAQTCHNVRVPNTPEEAEPDPLQTVLNCRRQFVVTSMREIDR